MFWDEIPGAVDSRCQSAAEMVSECSGAVISGVVASSELVGRLAFGQCPGTGLSITVAIDAGRVARLAGPGRERTLMAPLCVKTQRAGSF